MNISLMARKETFISLVRPLSEREIDCFLGYLSSKTGYRIRCNIFKEFEGFSNNEIIFNAGKREVNGRKYSEEKLIRSSLTALGRVTHIIKTEERDLTLTLPFELLRRDINGNYHEKDPRKFQILKFGPISGRNKENILVEKREVVRRIGEYSTGFFINENH